MSAQPTTANPYRRRYNLLAIGSLIAGSVIAFLVLLVVFHHNPITALLVGFCWGSYHRVSAGRYPTSLLRDGSSGGVSE